MKNENNNFKMGFRDGLPICLGYFSVSFAFGIFAVKSGLYIWQTLLISMFNLTSAGQLAAIPIIAAGGAFFELALTQLVINSRYALMSVSLSQKLGESVRFRDRFWIAFANTDEIFAVAGAKGTALGRRYLWGLAILPYVGWSVGTLFGAVAGEILPEILLSSLGIALYAMFFAIVVPEAKRSVNTGACVIFAVALSCVLRFVPIFSKVPSGFKIIICTVIASTLFAILCPVGDSDMGEAGE